MKTSLAKPRAWQPTNSHLVTRGGVSAQHVEEWGFPYPGCSTPRKSPSCQDRTRRKQIPAGCQHHLPMTGTARPPASLLLRGKAKAPQTSRRDFFCLIILLKTSTMPEAPAPFLFLSRAPAVPQTRDNPSWAAGEFHLQGGKSRAGFRRNCSLLGLVNKGRGKEALPDSVLRGKGLNPLAAFFFPAWLAAEGMGKAGARTRMQQMLQMFSSQKFHLLASETHLLQKLRKTTWLQ